MSDQYMVDKKALEETMQKTFVRGELEALNWVIGAQSLSEDDKQVIKQRITRLNQFLNDEIPADRDGTKARPIPKFGAIKGCL